MYRSKLSGRWLLTASCLGLCLAADARAEPDGAEEALPGVAHEKAVQTFKEGIEAFDRRDFEAARVAFLQTFALKPSAPVVRRNLGLAEIYSGHYLEGARRLARVIHTTDEGTSQDRARMLESLKKAEAHLERLTVEVNVEGAEIVVGDVALGPSPLPFVWYVAPGSYEVRIAKAGFSTFTETRLARAGALQHLRVALQPTPPVPVAHALTSPSPSPDRGRDGGPDPWLLAAGGALTAGAFAAGVTFSLYAGDNNDKVERLRSSLAEEGCVPAINPRCGELSSAADQHDRQVRWAAVSFAVAGAAGISTLLYGLLAAADAGPRTGSAMLHQPLHAGPRLVAVGFDSQSQQLLLTASF
jgi:hypothetical protein